MKKQQKEVLAQMGVTAEVLAHCAAAETQEEGERRLDAAKATCKKGFRDLAVKMHPDVGGDPKEFLRVKSCYESFMKAKYKGWRRRPKHSPLGADPYARPRTSGPDRWDNLYPNDPTLANFWRMKTARQEHDHNDLMAELMRNMRNEQAMRDLFAEGLFGGRHRQGFTARGETRSRPRTYQDPKPAPKHAQQEFYLADNKGIWRKCLSKSTPNPDIEKLRQRRARK